MPIRIKPFILEMIGRYVSNFHEMSTKRKGYWFRSDGHQPYYEFVAIGSSQKERVLGCDVAWGFFPAWDGAYGTHQMTASPGLPTLRLGSNAIPMEESYYEHDGTEAGIRRTLDRIGSELATYALPWFRSRAEEASHDRLLQHGIDWLRAHEQSISATVQDALKSELRDFAAKIGASPLHRKETALLAQHLLIYAGENKRNVA